MGQATNVGVRTRQSVLGAGDEDGEDDGEPSQDQLGDACTGQRLEEPTEGGGVLRQLTFRILSSSHRLYY